MTARTRTWVYLIIALGVVVATWVLVHGLTQRVQHAEDRAADATTAAQTLAQQVRHLGGTPKVTPSDIPGPAGARGPTGRPGATGPAPSRAEVLAAVDAYCFGGRCAHGPTAAQVSSAVAAYCNARGDCRGAQGGVGPMGAPGASGPAGTNGQNATDAQVQAAVSAYCDAHNQCQGPKGDTGSTGPAGYPVEFTFTAPSGIPGQSTTYDCTDADGDHNYDCTQETP